MIATQKKIFAVTLLKDIYINIKRLRNDCLSMGISKFLERDGETTYVRKEGRKNVEIVKSL